ncbi:MAG: histidine--tRNA ligase [Bdellovibrionota bacterium]
MSFLSTNPYKGTRDFFPAEKRLQSWMFHKIREVVQGFGYLEYDGPLFEPFELYEAKSGSELVNQQLYSMVDRGDRKIAARPEMTPTLARMVASRINEEPRPVRWFSIPNCWRYERPQRGRLREFWQLNVDVLGGDRRFGDAELIQLAVEIFRAFGGESFLQIRVNSRTLVDHVFKTEMGLDEEQSRALARLIDAKAKMEPAEFWDRFEKLGLGDKRVALDKFLAMRLETVGVDFPGVASQEITDLFATLARLGVSQSVVFDPSIMRGLDYYTGVVFEAFDISPENNRALFGGGRYDNLLGLFSKNELSGTGFGLGDVTLQNFLETHKLLPEFGAFCDLYCVCADEAAWVAVQKAAIAWRKAGLRVLMPLSLGSFKSQFKEADRFKTPFTVVVGAEELSSDLWTLKEMKTGEQTKIKASDIPGRLRS